MGDIEERLAGLSAEKRALLEKRLQRNGISYTSASQEAIAVTGMACRLPGGVESPDGFWQLLINGIDAISEVPTERWNWKALECHAAETTQSSGLRWGGFLQGIDLFDSNFFNISPREAAQMDPQQRLVLMVAWEALERSGYPRELISGSRAGVFMGVHSQSSDYYRMQLLDMEKVDTYTGTGGAHSIIANRLSYFLDLRGPSIAIDTACSSSLVALHLACQSLDNKECDMALAGGVNLNLTPENSIAFSKLEFLSPEGRCKTFDKTANGFVRGEGCGVVVLRRLADALEDHDSVLAVIRGSAVNQDGATNGITAPNGPSQEMVVRRALEKGGVAPEKISYVETHGTGTVLGDPIEIEALTAVLGSSSKKRGPCFLGAVKSHIGHLEGAAGIAGLIKTVLCLQHRFIPANVHFNDLNPHIVLEGTPFVIPIEGQVWNSEGGDRFAGVSSFGFGGTNAHVILQEAPAADDTRSADRPKTERLPSRFLLPLSAQSEDALRAVVSSWRSYLEKIDEEKPGLYNICYTASLRRSHLEHRLAFVGGNREELLKELKVFEEKETRSSLSSVRRDAGSDNGLVFVFSGQGPQWFGMGRQLLEEEPVYREMVKSCDALLKTYSGWSLLEELAMEETRSRLDRTEIAQPAIFALQMGLVALWKSWGIEPDGIIGHSVGEVAAACAAGVLDLDEAIRVVYHRGRLLQRASGQGKMAAVGLSLEEAERLVAPYGGRLSVAALNSPSLITLSGEAEPLREILASLERRNVFCSMLKVNYAFHSPQVEPFRQEMCRSVEDISPKSANIPIISTVRGKAAVAGDYGPTYWSENMRDPVRFSAAAECAIREGLRIFLEIGPHPVLAASIRQCLELCGRTGHVLASLRKRQAERDTMLEALGSLFVQGRSVKWQGVYPRKGTCAQLPTYPWQKKKAWISRTDNGVLSSSRKSSLGFPVDAATVHPLLGRRIDSPLPAFETLLDLQSQTFLSDHRIDDAVIAPAAMYLEMIAALAEAVLGGEACSIEDMTIHEALPIPDPIPVLLQTFLTHSVDGEHFFRIFSADSNGEKADHAWRLHTSGKMFTEKRGSADKTGPPGLIEQPKRHFEERLSGEEFYRYLERRSLQFGSSFQGIEEIWLNRGEALGKIILPQSLRDQADLYFMHPALLDACFQILAGLLPKKAGDSEIFLMTRLGRFRFYRRPGTSLYSSATLKPVGGGRTDTYEGQIRIMDEAGETIAQGDGLLLKIVKGELLEEEPIEDWIYDVAWRPVKKSTGTGRNGTGEPASPPSPSGIAAPIQSRFDELSSLHGLKSYRQLSPHLEGLAAAYAVRALRQMGLDVSAGQGLSADSLAERLGVAENHLRLFTRILEMLAEQEILKNENSNWSWNQTAELKDPEKWSEQLLDQYPDCDTELRLLSRCGGELGQVLQGRCNPLNLLFPEDGLISAQDLYQDASFSKTGNLLVRHAIIKVYESLPAPRKIRILELGAGTGGTTSFVLPSLPADRTEYVFTDVSTFFTTAAQQKFRDFPCVTYQLLDIEKDPESQGFSAQQFDIIIAANVLHATGELRRSLENIKQLLAPDGLVMILELTSRESWIDMIFGMTTGWWGFADRELRPSHPLLTPEQWLDLLQETGFGEVEKIPGAGSELPSHFSLILGRRPSFHKNIRESNLLPALSVEAEEWLIFADRGGLGEKMAESLEQQGKTAVLVYSGDSFAVDGGCVTINPSLAQDYQRLLAERPGKSKIALGGVLHLWSLDTLPFEQATDRSLGADQLLSTGSVLHLAQSLLNISLSGDFRLWLVTRGSQMADTADKPDTEDTAEILLAPDQAPLWGLGRVIALEHPELGVGLVDLDGRENPHQAVLRLLEEILYPDGEDQLAFRGERRLVYRLERGTVLKTSVPRIREDGSYLITGGLGGLGLILAKWLAVHGARNLLLTGRRRLPERGLWHDISQENETYRQVQAIREIELLGASVEIEYVDVSNREQMSGLFSRFGGDLAPLRGLFHCAAVIDLQPIKGLSFDDFKAAYSSKLIGTWILHRLTMALPLDFFVLFSSITSLLGSSSLAPYVAANQFLDAMAHYRHQAGLPALSVNWGIWRTMRLFSAEEQEKVMGFGLKPMASPQALHALAGFLQSKRPQVGIASIDWSVLKPSFEAKGCKAFLSEIEEIQRNTKEYPEEKIDIAAKLEAASANERLELLSAYIRELVCEVLGMDSSEPIDTGRGFFEMGMDSLTAVELKRRLEAGFQQPFPTTLIFNYPTIMALTGYIYHRASSFEESTLSPGEHAGKEILGKERAEAELEQCSEEDLVEMLAEKLKEDW